MIEIEGGPPARSRRLEYVVHGKVTDGDGRPLALADVVVYRQRIRSRSALTSGRSGRDGSYRLTYSPPANLHGKLLIVVEMRSKMVGPIESRLTEAQPDLQIDLHPPLSDQSEFAQLVSSSMGLDHMFA